MPTNVTQLSVATPPHVIWTLLKSPQIRTARLLLLGSASAESNDRPNHLAYETEEIRWQKSPPWWWLMAPLYRLKTPLFVAPLTLNVKDHGFDTGMLQLTIDCKWFSNNFSFLFDRTLLFCFSVAMGLIYVTSWFVFSWVAGAAVRCLECIY